MERLSLLLLIVCAAIGAGLNSATDGPPPVAAAPPAERVTPMVGAPVPAVAGAILATPSEKTPTERIAARLAVRHTALPARERARLAAVIIEEAARHDLDPDLVMAVIEVESAGYHLAVSRVGALGLMQLMPGTGEELAGKLEIPWKGEDTLFDPVINVRLGTAYLRELADRYDGNFDIALAAYNWGPGRIDRRIRRGVRVPSLYIEQVRQAELRYAASVPARS